MKATEQIEAIRQTLSEDLVDMPQGLYELLQMQLITLQILVERDIVTAEQKGMTDAFAIINKIVTTNE